MHLRIGMSAIVHEPWPSLPFAAWESTKDTLHMCTQVIGKLRLAMCPFEPEWGNVPLYVTARGLTTSPIPYEHGTFEVLLDLVAHEVVFETSSGRRRTFPLTARPVADFYRETMETLADLGIDVALSTRPSEVPNPVPFEKDTVHRAYDPTFANCFFRVLSLVDVVMKEHRAHFFGRSTPVQFFWGTFDLALTRFSGRRVDPPLDKGIIWEKSGDAEQISQGFWPGDARFREAAFFAYAYPKPPGLENATVEPLGAEWNADMGEFILPYEIVRTAPSPRDALLRFLESTYDTCADACHVDRTLVVADTEGTTRALHG
jgi:hypothetical protein